MQNFNNKRDCEVLWEFYQEFLNRGISRRMSHLAVHTDSLSVAVQVERMSMSV